MKIFKRLPLVFILEFYIDNSPLKAVIFVIDSSSKERLSEAQGELVKLISEDLLKDACLLILANKQVNIFVILKLYAYGHILRPIILPNIIFY